MARKVETSVVCDVTGQPAVETVRFAVNDRAYEIDLSLEAGEDFRAALAGFVESARPAGKVPGGKRGAQAVDVRERRELTGKIREWARLNGYAVADRGAIPGEIRAKYEAATG